VDECKQLMAYAKSKNIEIGYALQVGLLDPTYWEIFTRACRMRRIRGARTIRTLAAGLSSAATPRRSTGICPNYTRPSREQIGPAMRPVDGTKIRRGKRIRSLKGDGATGFGLSEFIANANSNVFVQCDTANFLPSHGWLPSRKRPSLHGKICRPDALHPYQSLFERA